MDKQPLPAGEDPAAEEDARLIARLALRHPWAARTTLVVVGCSLVIVGALFGPDLVKAGVQGALRLVGVHVVTNTGSGYNDAGAGAAAAAAEGRQRQLLGEVIGEKLAIYRLEERAWTMERLSALEAREDARIDSVMMMVRRGRGGDSSMAGTTLPAGAMWPLSLTTSGTYWPTMATPAAAALGLATAAANRPNP